MPPEGLLRGEQGLDLAFLPHCPSPAQRLLRWDSRAGCGRTGELESARGFLGMVSALRHARGHKASLVRVPLHPFHPYPHLNLKSFHWESLVTKCHSLKLYFEEENV